MTAGPATASTPEYGRYYYENYEGTAYGRNAAWIARMGDIADQVVASLKPSRVLDAGCAMGILVEALRNRGVDADGIDISEFAISQIPDPTAQHCRAASLAEPIADRYDLVISIEVLEHIAEAELLSAMDNLCGVTDRILFSSTPYHYEDPTHINIKQPEQWSVEFARRGFYRDVNYDASFIEPWTVLYVRRDLDTADLVEMYDRSHWYQRREIDRTRDGIIELQAALARVEQSAGGGEGSIEERVEAAIEAERSTVVSAERELLLVRDELIGANAELGEARGRNVEVEAELFALASLRLALEERDRQYDELDAQYRSVLGSTSWRVMQKLLAPYRRARGISG